MKLLAAISCANTSTLHWRELLAEEKKVIFAFVCLQFFPVYIANKCLAL